MLSFSQSSYKTEMAAEIVFSIISSKEIICKQSRTQVLSDPQEKDKVPRLAYVAPTIPRRLASTSDIDEKENRWAPGAQWLCDDMHLARAAPAAHCCVLQGKRPNALHGVCSLRQLLLVLLNNSFEEIETL